jgi:hypothetical protein
LTSAVLLSTGVLQAIEGIGMENLACHWEFLIAYPSSLLETEAFLNSFERSIALGVVSLDVPKAKLF